MAGDHRVELERLGRLHAALSHVNQAIVRIHARTALLQRVCDVLVAQARFRMAWIGWFDPETGRILPVARAGDQQDYLDSIEVFGDERPEGRGPTGMAFRERREQVSNDMLNDPAMSPWREEFTRRGFRSSASFPISEGGAVRGTLSVYADEDGFFRPEETSLLTEVAADISFALDKLVSEEARLRAEAIAERERHFAQSLIEAMPGIFYFYDDQGRFLRWNKNFERVSGYSAEEIARMHPSDFFVGQEKSLVQQRIAEVFEHGEASVEASFASKDALATPYFLTGRRMAVEGVPHLLGVGFDITERLRAEEALRKSEERYRTTLETSIEGCQLLGFDWRYLYLNPAVALQNRRSNEELLGRTMQACWPGIEGTDVYRMIERCMTQRVSINGETEFHFPDGSTGWFDVRVHAVPEGVFVLSIDISRRKQAERDLRELNENLEQLVAARTADLVVARERAEVADRLKSAFLATMSHELRTPLNSILGFTGIVLKGMAGPINEEQGKQLGMVQGSARHLLDLINDVLDISKIEAGQLEVRWASFDLGASVERVVATFTPLAARKGLTLRSSLPASLPPMESDRRRFEQILLNLLNNALKFTDRGEVHLTVEIVGELDSAAGAHVRVQVRDSGIGMKPEDLSKLFQPFRQIDSGLQRQHEGTGLGLAISRRLTELLGGTIAVASVHGEGSTFTVELPLRRKVAT